MRLSILPTALAYEGFFSSFRKETSQMIIVAGFTGMGGGFASVFGGGFHRNTQLRLLIAGHHVQATAQYGFPDSPTPIEFAP